MEARRQQQDERLREQESEIAGLITAILARDLFLEMRDTRGRNVLTLGREQAAQTRALRLGVVYGQYTHQRNHDPDEDQVPISTRDWLDETMAAISALALDSRTQGIYCEIAVAQPTVWNGLYSARTHYHTVVELF
jgi:hypothetical protein